MRIDVRNNIRQVQRELNRARRQAMPTATMRAMNRTGKQMETAGVRRVSELTGLAQKAVRARLRRFRAFRNRLTYVLDAYGGATNIASFSGTRQTKKGVSSKAWGKRRVYRNAFLINDGRTAMKRVGNARLPIRPVFGPSIRKTFEASRPEIEQVARTRFPINLEQQMRHAFRRLERVR